MVSHPVMVLCENYIRAVMRINHLGGDLGVLLVWFLVF